MNESLNILISKLNRQLNEFDVHLHTVRHQKQELELHFQQIEERINQPVSNSLIVNPVSEINWLNFITQQQEKKEVVTLDLKNCQDLENKLEEKITRVQKELKMIEHYLEREEMHQKKRALG
ncbi:hypothetical protein Lste_1053 [Legionella steelei]|uniref:Uncharacterized protein n=1 Tax=Legionella steelei TaxID=947033 RepID=A0A0W0ZFU7_9GAMM|nr:hypothetical protein [Legionella steelei]KTD67895.1 hypothetical protein Lste_1053 [Legionella steelei]